MQTDVSTHRRVAFLRGVNVGGRNRLPMADLRAELASAGLERVQTYIQSGNIVFAPGDVPDDEASLTAAVSGAVERVGGIVVPVMVRTLSEIEQAVGGHPDVGSDVPPKWIHVWFLSDTVSGDDIDEDDAPDGFPNSARFAPDRLVLADRVAYATYPNGVAGSKLTIDVVERALGVTATARNVSTLNAVVALGRPA